MSASTPEPGRPIPLNYGRKPTIRRAWSRGWKAFRGDSRHSSRDYWKSLGYAIGCVIHAFGGERRFLLALGTAFVAGGLGLAIQRGLGGSGAIWMWIGGFLIGLLIPIKNAGSSK